MNDRAISKQEARDPSLYILEVEIDGTKFKFQSPTYKEMESLGLELLANTFGRYKADEIRKLLTLLNE